MLYLKRQALAREPFHNPIPLSCGILKAAAPALQNILVIAQVPCRSLPLLGFSNRGVKAKVSRWSQVHN